MQKRPIVVVTGAAGMIGSAVVRHLNDLGNHQLLLVDDLKSGDKWKNLVGKQFIELISKHALLPWLASRENEIDAVVHLGACADTTETNADYLLENNFRYTVRLAEWALKWDKRFIYASSAATYGDGAVGFEDDETKLELLKPLNMYGFSKHLVDLWMKQQGVLDRVVGLKYFNVFGPNEYHKGEMASMVFKMTHRAKQDGLIQLYKSNNPKYDDGEQQRDFIYIKDAVKLTCAFLDPKYRQICGIFNIGQGRSTTWNTLANALFKALRQSTHITYINMPVQLAHQYQNFTCAKMDKLDKIIPLATMPIESAVSEYVQHYLMSDSRW